MDPRLHIHNTGSFLQDSRCREDARDLRRSIKSTLALVSRHAHAHTPCTSTPSHAAPHVLTHTWTHARTRIHMQSRRHMQTHTRRIQTHTHSHTHLSFQSAPHLTSPGTDSRTALFEAITGRVFFDFASNYETSQQEASSCPARPSRLWLWEAAAVTAPTMTVPLPGAPHPLAAGPPNGWKAR